MPILKPAVPVEDPLAGIMQEETDPIVPIVPVPPETPVVQSTPQSPQVVYLRDSNEVVPTPHHLKTSVPGGRFCRMLPNGKKQYYDAHNRILD